MQLKLKERQLTTIGGSEGFIVDKAFIKNGMVSKKEKYTLIIIPKKEDDNNENKQIVYI